MRSSRRRRGERAASGASARASLVTFRFTLSQKSVLDRKIIEAIKRRPAWVSLKALFREALAKHLLGDEAHVSYAEDRADDLRRARGAGRQA
jgi:hypothetical protein